jgi:hypothetical protein
MRNTAPEIAQVVLRCVARNREDRFQTGRELADALDELLRNLGGYSTDDVARFVNEHAPELADRRRALASESEVRLRMRGHPSTGRSLVLETHASEDTERNEAVEAEKTLVGIAEAAPLVAPPHRPRRAIAMAVLGLFTLLGAAGASFAWARGRPSAPPPTHIAAKAAEESVPAPAADPPPAAVPVLPASTEAPAPVTSSVTSAASARTSARTHTVLRAPPKAKPAVPTTAASGTRRYYDIQ